MKTIGMKILPTRRKDTLVASTAPATSARWALASLALSMLLSSLGTSIANVGLPTLAQVFNAPFQTVQWVLLAYLLAMTTVIVSVGRLGDVIGRRRLLLAGLGLFTAASLLCGLAPELGWLIAARGLQGFGAAIMMALTLACVAETVPKAKTGSAMGLLGTMSAIGTALGPSLGGFLIVCLGWQALFFINLPLGVLTGLLAYRYLPPDRQAAQWNSAGFDLPGTLLLALTLVAYALALTVGRGHFGLLNLGLLGLAVFGLGLFVRAEKQAASPLIRLALFRNPVLSAGLVMSMLVMTVMMTTLVVGPFYLAGALGLDMATVGLVMSAGPIVSACAGVPAGRLVDRFGAHRMTLAGLALMVGACTSLPLLPTSWGVPGYLVPLGLLTAGYALFQAANNTAVMADTRPEQRGVVSGMLNLSRNLGLFTGVSVMGAVFAVASGSVLSTANHAALVAGMRATFAVAAGWVVLALVIAVGGRVLTQRLPPAAGA